MSDVTIGELCRRVDEVEGAVKDIREKLGSWVPPNLATLISVLTALLGFAGGVIAVLVTITLKG